MKHRAGVGAAARGLRTRVDDGVAWLTLDRPKHGNRITQELAQELCAAAAEIELDDRVAIVVIAASGANFCLGVEAGGHWERDMDWVDAIGQLTRPVVAALQGDALAEGLELALACDLRLAVERARFALPQLTDGQLPSHGGTQRLPRVVGRMRALDMLLTGRAIEAAEAEQVGLVTRVVKRTEFARALGTLLDGLKRKGPVALRYGKEAVLRGPDMTLDQGIRLEEDLYVLLQTTRDRQEGIDAFLRKRTPVFQGM
ncbi:MAG: enoyl-CoA hydratase/isomerase family protein [Candidatus Binatia bacterium]